MTKGSRETLLSLRCLGDHPPLINTALNSLQTAPRVKTLASHSEHPRVIFIPLSETKSILVNFKQECPPFPAFPPPPPGVYLKKRVQLNLSNKTYTDLSVYSEIFSVICTFGKFPEL